MSDPDADPTQLPTDLRFVPREKWGAAPPTSTKALRHPVEHVCFSYNTGSEPCYGDKECFKVLQKVQKDVMEQGLSDIPYNFLVGGDGTVYEGRGWNAHSSSSLGPSGTQRLDIAFIGEFERDSLPRVMYFNGIDLVYYAVRQQYVAKQYSFQESRYPPRLPSRIKNSVKWKLHL